MRKRRSVSVIAAGSIWSAVISKMKRRGMIEKSIHIEAIGIQISRQIIRRAEKDSGRVSGINANL